MAPEAFTSPTSSNRRRRLCCTQSQLWKVHAQRAYNRLREFRFLWSSIPAVSPASVPFTVLTWRSA